MRTTIVSNKEAIALADPWRDAPPVCRVYSTYAPFRKLLEAYLGGVVKLTDSPERGMREGLLVDCTESMDALSLANEKFPDHPIIAVLGEMDTTSAMETLARGADGVIALKDPPDIWRECVHVVLGGGRWLGGPGLDVQLEDNLSSYDIATNKRHKGDVTRRTKLFVGNRLADKTSG
jgi:DNA-binding NarL/FixJ family response regulator